VIDAHSRRMLAAALLLLLAGIGCQGGFDPPALDNPRDPANSDLPPTPHVAASGAGCANGVPSVLVTWSVSNDPEITGFQVYRSSRENIDPGLLIASVPANARQFVDGVLQGTSPLVGGVPYWYRVRVLGPNATPGFRSTPDSAVTPVCP
jgi:hypothetical protein